ncbi:molybdopterin molybdotransferase MoeA [Roseovarius sp. A21]|uniref:Molybdopterin molybdenumtransferase n=1 Tax=Roseovarius bejariae TaxID=2576383 RepID=A0A844CJ31_9RHOB|nr:gephyrin-like molybdotransferase Glp [Roseovarius bejariae]MRU14682.1 molybdopterin molybdotransferase MoeA [Roseovarius bejariae]
MTVFEKLQAAACDCDQSGHSMMSVRDAVQAALSLAAPVEGTEVLPLAAARGRVLALPVTAGADMPRFDNSGMDGYALRHEDLGHDGWIPVAGVSAAGDATKDLPAGVAMRIYTGAPLPRGADTVVMQEKVERTGDEIRLIAPCDQGGNIRKQGEDRRAGDDLLSIGATLDAKALALCAGAGAGQVTVYRRPRIAMVLTGDEITPAGEPLTGGAIWDVNGPMLDALCDEAGVEVVETRYVADTRADMASALGDLACHVDMIVTSGGVSVGDRDHVAGALHDIGAKTVVAGVAIKPGKPVTVANVDGALVLGLPGNPVSAFVTWHVLGRPLAARLAGKTGAVDTRWHVRAATALSHKLGRCEYRPARITGYDGDGHQVIACSDHMHSADLGPLAGADGLVLIPGDVEQLRQGDLLEFLPFKAQS